jgi:hypothetical protein
MNLWVLELIRWIQAALAMLKLRFFRQQSVAAVLLSKRRWLKTEIPDSKMMITSSLTTFDGLAVQRAGTCAYSYRGGVWEPTWSNQWASTLNKYYWVWTIFEHQIHLRTLPCGL